MKVLIVLTSHSELGNTGEKTGFWIEEFAAPYYVFFDAGVKLTIASPKGGQPPIDPKSESPDAQTESTKRYNTDQGLKAKLSNTIKLSEVNQSDYDAVFYPGGHGPLWDLANDSNSISLIEDFYKHKKPITFVCHAPGTLIKVKGPDGAALVKGKEVTGFSNTEEEAVKLTKVVPFLLEDEMKKLKAHYSKGPDWSSYVKKDGLLITGQNPASSAEAAKVLLKTIMESKKITAAPKKIINQLKGLDWDSYIKKEGQLITGQNPEPSEENAKVLIKTIKDSKINTATPKKVINKLKGILFPSDNK
jgi:putative intracellular protease/amidase